MPVCSGKRNKCSESGDYSIAMKRFMDYNDCRIVRAALQRSDP